MHFNGVVIKTETKYEFSPGHLLFKFKFKVETEFRTSSSANKARNNADKRLFSV